MVPSLRVLAMNEAPPQKEGEFVLYWMVANRRFTWNFALERAVAEAERLQKPLVILEDLRLIHQWASPRFHQWVIQGMEEQQRAFSCRTVMYHPYVETRQGEGRALLDGFVRGLRWW